jgi:DNA-binding MurR/RpiR family transcriptional regulator
MTESLTQRIHRVYDNLPAGERKAAELVLDSPGELALWAATELSDRAGVSNATVSRLFRRLGYGSYDEARRASREMRASGSPLYLADPAPARGRLADILAVETAVVADSLSMLNPLTVDAVAERMAAARRVRFAGFRNSHFAAAYAASALAQFRPGVALLTGAHQTLAEGIAAVGAGDLVVIVGLRRRPAGFSGFVSAVAATGADVALVTDRSVRGAPAMARWTLTCAVDTPQTLDSYSGALAVLRALVLAAVARLGVAGRRHLERIETLHETLGELE